MFPALAGRFFTTEPLGKPKVVFTYSKNDPFQHIVFFLLIVLFIYFWLHLIFIALRGLSPVAASRGYSSLRYAGFSMQ